MTHKLCNINIPLSSFPCKWESSSLQQEGYGVPTFSWGRRNMFVYFPRCCTGICLMTISEAT